MSFLYAELESLASRLRGSQLEGGAGSGSGGEAGESSLSSPAQQPVVVESSPPPAPSRQLMVSIRRAGVEEVFFRVNTSSLLDKVFAAYAVKQRLPRSSFSFSFGDAALSDGQTPQAAALQDGSVLTAVLLG